VTAGPPTPDRDQDADAGAEVRAEFDAFAARHRHDPPLAVLRAASADALPSGFQEQAAAALDASPWRRQILDGAHEAEGEADLTPQESEALLARIHREAALVHPAGGRRPLRAVIRFGLPLLAAAALVFAVVMVRPVGPPPTPTSDAAPVVATPAAPAFRIAIEAAPVKLTAAALTRRSPGQAGVFTDDAAPAFSAYRAGRFADAATAFTDLARRYPNAPEAAFYLGVSRLLSGDPTGAHTALMAARTIDDPIFRDDVAWYLAASEERMGQTSAARDELRALCQGHSALASRACEAAAGFPAK